MKKALKVILWSLLTGGLLLCVGFANREGEQVECQDPVITIYRNGENYFVEEEHVRDLITGNGGPLKGQPLGSIKVDELERIVNTNPWVANAEVYVGLDGKLRIDVKQKEPLVRIINDKGESYYLDTDGNLMVWSPTFSPRILMVNGHVTEGFSRWYTMSMSGKSTPDSVKNLTILDEVFWLSKYIRSDTLWNAQFEQVYVNDQNEFELIPKVGDHRILFGDTSEMKEKFTKLALFYMEGLNHTGWNLYDTINLKFKNQVVCSKIN